MIRTGKSAVGEDAHEQAAWWLMKLRDAEDAPLSGDDLQAWQRFTAVPENLAAFEAVQRAASAANNLARPPLPTAEELAADRYDGSMPVSEWHEGRAKRWRAPRWMLKRPLLTAALSAVAALMLLAMVLQTKFSRAEDISVFKTGPGELREVTLADGSAVSLGAGSSMSVHYSNAKRVIFFEQGDALFTVAHNRERPFQVVAGRGTVTAVGTQFNVKHTVDRVTVTVTDGTVDVTPLEETRRPESKATTSAWNGSRLARGQQLTFKDDGTSTGALAADSRAATSWREGRLEYRHVPLKYVVADVNRYFTQQVVLGDNAAAQLEFTGTVFQNQPLGEWLQALESIFEVRVIRTDEQHVLVQSAQAGPPVPR